MGLEPWAVEPAELDEHPLPTETPRQLALRLAVEKAARIRTRHAEAYVVAADTVVAVGRRILPKVEHEAQGRACLDLLSGRAHRVLTGVAVAAPDGRTSHRLVASRVTFKRLTAAEIEGYLSSKEGVGKAGGYAVQGRAGAFVTRLQGSYTGVVGLPLYETSALLAGLGFRLP
jgi:septum formation protein